MIYCASLWLAFTLACTPSAPRQYPFPEPTFRLFADERRRKRHRRGD